MRTLVLISVVACSRPPAAPVAPAADRVAIVVAERGDHGIHLVGIDEHGDRQFELVRAADEQARDSNPAISPDGKWIVFASSRGRPIAETNLWIARALPDAIAVPLTHSIASPDGGAAVIDSHPVWRPDGRSIVFDSTRAHGDYDLYELAIHVGRASGEPVALTSAPGHEVTPTVARDGTIIYAAIRPLEGDNVESHLEARHPDGTIERLTEGPGDVSPALSPDQMQIAFARPAEHAGVLDSELWIMPRAGGDAEPLVDVTLTDETGPVWSADGRFVFATSVLRGARGNVVFSSVIVVDLTQHPRVARILEDRTGPLARITPAIAPIALDARALDADPEYLSELARITANAAAANPPP
jgi:Tol biopolymer transport system component